MSQEVQGMLIQLEATTAQLRREMATADSVVGRTTKSIDDKLSKVDGAFDRVNVSADKAVRGAVSSLRGLVAPIAAAASAMAALRKGVDVQREFDRLNAGLITATGSSEKASAAFQALREFAQKTPYDLGQAVEGFTKLVNLGLTPSEKALMSYGNTASSMGKDLNQMIEAVADAATGEFERLKEFGIKASKQGDQVALTFQGVTTSIGNNAAEIEKYLIDLGENQFAGAMELRMQSLDGAIANLGDTWDQTFQLINDAGAGELMRSSVVMVVEALKELNAMLASGELEGYLDAIGGKFEGWGKDIESTLNVLGDLFDSLFTEMGESAQSELSMLTDAFENFPENVRAFIQLMTVEVLAGFETAAAYAASFKDKVKAVFTDDTFGDVSSRLAAELNRINGVRDSSIESILGERDAAVGSYNAQIAAAEALRKKHDEERAASARSTADRLAQHKIEKEGQAAVAGASDKATAAVKKQISAIDALIAKYDPALKAQKDYDAGMALADSQYKANKISVEQYQKVVQGLYADLNKPIWAQHNKQADEAAKRIKAVDEAVQGVLDRLDPATAAARKYAAEQKSITDAMREHPERADEYRGALEKLRAEYDDNQRAASQWGQFTERALDSVDQSFAAAWKNIDQGFSGFADSLKDAFKNLLAELAHLAITRPILMQIGTALGVGGLAGQSSGLLGSLGGGDSAGGGMDVFSLVKNGYNIANSGFGQAVAQGWGSGGLSGAVSGGWNYGSSAIGGLFGSGAASGGGSAIADYTGAQFGNWVGAQNAAATTWGGAATGLGSIMGGLSGAYMGYQNAGVKGAVAGGLGGWGGGTLGTMAGAAAASALSGTAMGAALGSVLPGIGTVIGAALGAAFGSKLFGGDWETKDAGLAFGVEGGDLSAQSFEYQKKKGGLFSSNKKRTKYNALDAESEAQFQGIFDATEDGVSDLLARVGISVEEGALDGLSIARRQISTQGKTDEEVQQLIGEWFSHVSDRMVAEIDGGTKGIGYSFEELAARIQSFELFNATLDTINVTLLELIPNSMAIANNLVAVAGGMEQYQTSLAGYYDNFFSDAEKTEGAIKAITEAFESADITLASSREGYRAMLEAVDLTSVAGQSMFSSLLSMAAQADAYYDILDQRAAQAAQDASNSYSLAFSAVQRAAAAEKSAAAKAYEARVSSFNDMAATATGRISELTSISGALNTALKALRGTSADAVQMLRANALAVLDSALATSRSDGSIAGIANLPDALDTIGRNNTDLYGSMEDFARDQGLTANIISELEATSGKQLTAEKQLLKTVEEMARTAQWQYDAEMARIDSQLAYAQAQVDAVNGVNTSVLSMAAAIANLNSTMLRALATGAAGGSGAASANTPGNNASIVDGLYQSILGRDPDSAGAAYWAGQLQSGAIDYAAVAAAIERDAKINGELPAFAMGGMHRGGLRLVGENGPELEVTGPARIYSNSQTAAMLGGSGGDTAAEVRGLRADLAGMTDALKSVAKHTMQTARRVEYLERWDVDGAPPERAIA